jgi:hypothetical protein
MFGEWAEIGRTRHVVTIFVNGKPIRDEYGDTVFEQHTRTKQTRAYIQSYGVIILVDFDIAYAQLNPKLDWLE